MDVLNKHINPNLGPISMRFHSQQISDVQQAFEYVKQLPYGRNVNKSSLLTVLDEGRGTCSTKHSLLKRLCDEQELHDVLLFTRVFEMSGNYHPEVEKVLNQHNLNAIPEAHVFLKISDEIVDCTSSNSAFDAFINSTNLHEQAIEPEQSADYKIELHKKVMSDWLYQHRDTISYSLEDLWNIREQCIHVLT